LFCTAAGAVVLLAAPGIAADSLIAPETLQTLEREADTPAEHATIAKQYRLRAESFETQAIKHEAKVRQYTNAAGPMVHKWPAMAPRALQKEKELAVEARRAARENRELAQRHMGLSVEALAQDTNPDRVNARP